MTRNPSERKKGRASAARGDPDGGVSRRPDEGVSRRTVLKSASAAGAGATVFPGTAAAIENGPGEGTVRFGDVGVAYRLEADDDLRRADDCVHPQYDVVDDRVVFYTDALTDDHLSVVRSAGDVVAGRQPRSVPADDVGLMDAGFLPTTLGDALHPRRGVVVAGSHSPPAPRVRRAGDDLVVRTRGPAVRVAPGETATVDLDATAVEARTFERRPTEGTSEKVPGKTVESGATYVPTTETVAATPTLTVRNHGKLTLHTAANRMEAGR